MNAAADKFIEYCEARKQARQTIGKYKLLTRELKRWFSGRRIESIDLDDLSSYQASWGMAPISCVRKVGRLRKFFKFCVSRNWVRENKASGLELPICRSTEVLPFRDDEMEKLIWATEVYPDRPPGRREQVRAFVLLLRYSGLRIGDAVALRREKLQNGKLKLRTAKTGTPVFIPLPREVNEKILALEGDYLFWTGEGTLRSGISSWQRTLKKLFGLAGVVGHPHQFRHTFSVDLLSHGVPIEDVAILLGHSSSAITAKYYNQFVKSGQERLEANVQKAWKL